MPRGTPVPAASRASCAYGALTLCGRPSQRRSASARSAPAGPYPGAPRAPVWAPPVPLAATPGITLVFFSSGYLDVSVRRVPPRALSVHARVHEVCSCGLPHSDTCGSQGMCPSPQLFAACRVLPRPPVPGHPPCALSSLAIRARLAWRAFPSSFFFLSSSLALLGF